MLPFYRFIYFTVIHTMKTALKKLIKPPPSLDKGQFHNLCSHFQSFKVLNQVLFNWVFPAIRFADEYCIYSVKVPLLEKLRFKSLEHFITGMKVSVRSTPRFVLFLIFKPCFH